MHRFPKTPRLDGTKLPAESDLQVVVTEKVDGANVGIHFEDGQLVLQSRGHTLRGGPSERLFTQLHGWAYRRLDDLKTMLKDRYVLFGEWVAYKNRIFYDGLPDSFLAFDLYDKQTQIFRSTATLRGRLPISIWPVETLWVGSALKAKDFMSLVGDSKYKTHNWHKVFTQTRDSLGLKEHYADHETDMTQLMEGVYVKFERDDTVVARAKYPRPDFEKIHTDDAKWGRRPLFPNRIKGST